MFDPLLAVSFEAFTQPGFWIGVGVIAGIYTLLALGLQLNVGFTGIVNFGQAAFMAIGAYSMAILVIKAGFSFWLALPMSRADHDRLRAARRAAGRCGCAPTTSRSQRSRWPRSCACSPRTHAT